MSSIFSTIAITAGLIVLIPLAMAAERADVNTWHARLVLPEFKDNLNRHTPLHATGTVLPPMISTNLTLTAADNPVIIVRETVVPRGVTLTLEGGANVFAHEFAQLTVAGTLHVRGTPQQPIELTTNERHPDNKIWNGILAAPAAVVSVQDTAIRYAAPAITCLPGSTVATERVQIKNTNQENFGC